MIVFCPIHPLQRAQTHALMSEKLLDHKILARERGGGGVRVELMSVICAICMKGYGVMAIQSLEEERKGWVCMEYSVFYQPS